MNISIKLRIMGSLIIFLLLSSLLLVPVQAQDPAQEPSEPRLIRLLAGTFDPLADPEPAILPEATVLAYPGDGTGYYLVQFEGPIYPQDVEALKSSGATVFDYIPDFAFIVKMDYATRVTVERIEGVRWVGIYQPSYRLQPKLVVLASQAGSGESEVPIAVELDKPIKVSVLTFPGEDMTAIVKQVEALGGAVSEQSQNKWGGILEVAIPPSQLASLASISGVDWVEEAVELKLANDVATDIMNVRDVWNTHGLFGAGQVVAVADSGLDQGSTAPANLHDDFEDGNGNSRVAQIFDLVGDGADDVLSGHGTHVAGSVLGNGDLSGASPITHTYPAAARAGTAPEATLVFQAIGSITGTLPGIPANTYDLFQQASNAGADLHNNSWGAAATGAYTARSRHADQFVWDNNDFTILFAAGNEGVDADSNGVIDHGSMDAPGTAKNVITVGASENDRSGQTNTYGGWWPADYPSNPVNSDRMADDVNGLAAFSSRGPVDDGRFKPDLVAPGTWIASTRSSVASGTGWGAINADYMFNGGTSMATPLTTGAATIVRQFYTTGGIRPPSAALIKATLINGARDMHPGQYGTGATQEITRTRPTNVAGWGRVDLENSIFPATPRSLSVIDQRTGLTTGQTHQYALYNITNSSQPLRVTLVWTDFPGTTATGGALVNDLDLSVVDPNGTTFLPNNANRNGQLTLHDRVNNVNGIDIGAPATGVYIVTIRGRNIPQGPQPYALVVSGVMDGEVRVDANATGFENGTAANPFNSVAEGVGAVPGGGDVYIVSNSYNERLTIYKGDDPT